MRKNISLAGALLAVLMLSACSSAAVSQTPAPTPNPGSNVPAISPSAVTAPSVATPAVATASTTAATSSVQNLSIVSSASQAKFSMNEFLKGVSTFVVGTSTQLTGNITVDTAKPAQIKIGAIKLDATSLITDNAMRNKNIVNLIFKSNQPQNQFIVFQPTKVSGVPTVLTPGQSFPVKIIGDLTISGTTKPATFTGTINWRGDGTVVGTATTEVTYANFGLVIPNFPFLSNIDKVAKLEVDVTAAPVQ